MEAALDFSGFLKDQVNYLEQLRKKKVIVSFSGGKDSTVILHFLSEIHKKFDFEIEAHGVINPVHAFTQDELTRINKYWKERDIEIVWHHTGKDNDDDLSTLIEKGESPCVRCSETKKLKLLEYLKENDENFESLAIVVGHSLWDLSSALIEHILRAEFGGGDTGNFQGKKINDRFLEISQRFYPLIKMENGLFFYKPLIFYNDKDIENVIHQENIPVLASECMYKNYRPKRLLSEYYKLYQLNFNYDQLLEFARKNLDLPDAVVYEKSNIKDFVKNYI